MYKPKIYYFIQFSVAINAYYCYAFLFSVVKVFFLVFLSLLIIFESFNQCISDLKVCRTWAQDEMHGPVIIGHNEKTKTPLADIRLGVKTHNNESFIFFKRIRASNPPLTVKQWAPHSYQPYCILRYTWDMPRLAILHLAFFGSSSEQRHQVMHQLVQSIKSALINTESKSLHPGAMPIKPSSSFLQPLNRSVTEDLLDVNLCSPLSSCHKHIARLLITQILLKKDSKSHSTIQSCHNHNEGKLSDASTDVEPHPSSYCCGGSVPR